MTIALATVAFVLVLGLGLFTRATRHTPPPERPVSTRRMRRLWIIDGDLERGPNLEHHHPTIFPKEDA